MKPAARTTDLHTCPMSDPKPHFGGPILLGSSNVLIDYLPAAKVGSQATCVGPIDVIVQGSGSVFINFTMASRLGDMTAHGGVITCGSTSVIIGD